METSQSPNPTITTCFCALHEAFGPMIRTTDPEKMKKEISKLKATGGGDAPEMCLSGLQVLK